MVFAKWHKNKQWKSLKNIQKTDHKWTRQNKRNKQKTKIDEGRWSVDFLWEKQENISFFLEFMPQVYKVKIFLWTDIIWAYALFPLVTIRIHISWLHTAFFHRIAEYTKLEGTHRDHWVQLLVSHSTTQLQPLCLRKGVPKCSLSSCSLGPCPGESVCYKRRGFMFYLTAYINWRMLIEKH